MAALTKSKLSIVLSPDFICTSTDNTSILVSDITMRMLFDVPGIDKLDSSLSYYPIRDVKVKSLNGPSRNSKLTLKLLMKRDSCSIIEQYC